MSQYEAWVQPRPNNAWQVHENQTFIDQTRVDNAPLDDEDEDTSDNEEEEAESSDDLSDAEEIDNESEGEGCDEEDDAEKEDNPACDNFNCPVLTDKEVPGTDQVPGRQLSASGCQEPPTRRPEAVPPGSTEQEDSIVDRFLEVMEDQDLHRDSITRLRKFFKTATLEELEDDGGETKESRILLEDRNFAEKCFRPYPKSMTAKELYSALRKQVRRATHRQPSRLITTHRDTRPRPHQSLRLPRRIHG